MGITPFAGGTDWFKSTEMDPTQEWNTTIAPELTAAQTAYNNALTAKNTYEPIYTTSKTTMITLMNGSLATPAELAALKAAIDDFEAKKTEFNNRIATLRTAANTLIEKQIAAYQHIEDLGDPYLTGLLTLLSGEIDQELTLQGFDSNTLLTELTDADGVRTAARTDYLTAIGTLQDAQKNLTAARASLAGYLDDQLLAQAKINFNNAGGAPPYANATNDYNTATAGVTAQTNIINGTPPDGTPPGLLSLRDSALTDATNNLNSYTDAIDAEVAVLEEGHVTHTETATNFINALEAASQAATTTIENARQAGIENDAELFATHTSGFPQDNPAVASLINSTLSSIVSACTTLQADLGTPIDVTRYIDIPELPPAGTMSINDLMRFITAIERVISQLTQALRNADNNINTLRMKIWDNQSRFDLTLQTAQLAWLEQVEAADKAYNLQVAIDNHNLSQSIYDKVNFILSQETEINAVIAQLNSDIAAQNAHAINVTNALNNANFIAVDVINYGQQIPPDTVNQSDVTNLDATVTSPAARTDVPLFPAPATIPDYPPFVAADFEIPASIPVPIPGPEDDIPPPVGELPTATQVEELNAIIDELNRFLYPLKERLVAAGIEQLEGLPYDAVDMLYIRQYVPVRTTPEVLDQTIPSLSAFLYGILATLSQRNREYAASLNKGLAPPFPQQLLDQSRLPVTEDQHETAGATGAGVGIISANLVGSQPRVLAAVGTVLESTDFQNTIEGLLEQGSLIGGLQTTTLLPTLFANYSQMGLVRSDLSLDVGAAATARVEGAQALTEADQIAATNTATELIGIAGNVGPLRDRILDVIKRSGATDLSEDEIKALISLLLLLIQLILLLVAALLLAAAGGEDSLETILEQVFSQEEVVTVVNELRELGVEGIPEVLPRTVPELVETLATVLEVNLEPPDLDLFEEDVITIFAERGIELTFQEGIDLATQIATALFTVPPEVQNEIRVAILATEIIRAQILRTQVANDAARAELNDSIQTIPLPVREQIIARLNALPPLPPLPTFISVRQAVPIVEAEAETQAIPIPVRTAERPQPAVSVPAQARVSAPLPVPETVPVVETETVPLAVAPPVVEAAPFAAAPPVVAPLPTPPPAAAPVGVSPVVTPTVAPRAVAAPIAQAEPVEVPREVPREPLRISDEDRNTLVLAIAGRIINPENARNIVDRLLLELTNRTSPEIGQLFQRAIDAQANVRGGGVAPGATLTTAPVPQAAGIKGLTSAPQILPKDAVALLRDAFINLGVQIDDTRLLDRAIASFSRSVEGQTDFFQRSLDLVLDPARTMIRNFSIYTRDGSAASRQTPLVIPLSG